MCWSGMNGSRGSSVVCRQCVACSPFALQQSWWAACFLTLKLTRLSHSLGWLNLSLSVREPPVMSFLTTTYVLLQASFLLCSLDYSIAMNIAQGACFLFWFLTFIFQVTEWFICSLTKELTTGENISETLKLAHAFLESRNACIFPPWMDYKHSCSVSTVLFLSKCFISVSILLLVMQWILEVCLNV